MRAPSVPCLHVAMPLPNVNRATRPSSGPVAVVAIARKPVDPNMSNAHRPTAGSTAMYLLLDHTAVRTALAVSALPKCRRVSSLQSYRCLQGWLLLHYGRSRPYVLLPRRYPERRMRRTLLAHCLTCARGEHCAPIRVDRGYASADLEDPRHRSQQCHRFIRISDGQTQWYTELDATAVHWCCSESCRRGYGHVGWRCWAPPLVSGKNVGQRIPSTRFRLSLSPRALCVLSCERNVIKALPFSIYKIDHLTGTICATTVMVYPVSELLPSSCPNLNSHVPRRTGFGALLQLTCAWTQV